MLCRCRAWTNFRLGKSLHLKGFRGSLRRVGVAQSMGAAGTSADNSLPESFNAALEREVLQDNTCWEDVATCRR